MIEPHEMPVDETRPEQDTDQPSEGVPEDAPSLQGDQGEN